MAEGTPNIGDLFGALGGNPLNTIGKTVEQMKRGASDLVAAAELMRSTLENLNSVATRMNRMLDDIEEPVRAAVPQITRAVKLANSIVDQMVDPIERVAPGLNRLADTLSSQSLTNMPKQLGEFLDGLTDLSHRLAPLAQLAESAGGFFGMRGLAALSGATSRTPSSSPTPPPPPASPPPPVTRTAVTASSPTRAPAKKRATKKTAAKKTTAKKTTAKKTTAKKTTAKRSAAKNDKRQPRRRQQRRQRGRLATTSAEHSGNGEVPRDLAVVLPIGSPAGEERVFRRRLYVAGDVGRS